MKRFFMILLSTVLVLTMATASLAVEFGSEIGGRFYGYFSTIKGDRGFNPAPGTDAWDTILSGTVRQTNNWGASWARISYIASSWEQTINHAFGIDNIAGSPWSIGFDTHDTGTCNIGQRFMGDLFNDFKADPYFCTSDMDGSFNLKYLSNTFDFLAEARVYDGDGSTDNITANSTYHEAYAATFIFKNGLNKYYIAGQHFTAWGNDSFYDIGAMLKLSAKAKLNIDFWSDKGGHKWMGEFRKVFCGATGEWTYGGSQSFQATLEYGRITGQLLYILAEDDNYNDSYGVGGAYQLNDRFTAGVKYFDVTKVAGVSDDGYFYDVYGDYNVGAWGLKLGVSNAQFAYGQNGPNNKGDKSSIDYTATKTQATQSADPFVYIGVHFEF